MRLEDVSAVNKIHTEWFSSNSKFSPMLSDAFFLPWWTLCTHATQIYRQAEHSYA